MDGWRDIRELACDGRKIEVMSDVGMIDRSFTIAIEHERSGSLLHPSWWDCVTHFREARRDIESARD